MKKIILSAAFLFSIAIANKAEAQVRLSVNFNIGSQPEWGPVGYDHVDYYYLPDIETYYNVSSHQFVYLQGRNWVFSYSLPPRYSSFDLYSGYKVVVNEPRPYLHNDVYRARYSNFRGNHNQVVIRNSNEPKYAPARGHYRYQKNKGWMRNDHDNDHNNNNNHGNNHH